MNKEVQIVISAKELASQAFKKLGMVVDATENKLDKFGNKLTGIGANLTVGLSTGLALAGGAAIKMGMDAVESENLFTVSMGKMADSARKWSDGLRQQLGLNSYEVRRNVGVFNVMLTSIGLTEKAAFGMSKGLTELAYDMASFYNLKPEEAFEKIQAGISGESEPLKRLGIIVNETTTKNWALTHGMIKQGQELSETGKVMARYNVIMEATNKAQGDLARTADSPANKLRILKQEIQQSATELGVSLLPAVQSFLNMAQPFVEQISKAVQWFSALPEPIKNTAIGIVGLGAALGPVLLVVGNITKAVGALIGMVQLINPVILIISAVALTIAVVYKSWNANLFGIQDASKKFVDNIVKSWTLMWEAIKAYAIGIGNVILGIGQIMTNPFKAKDGFKTITDGIKGVVKSAGLVGEAFKAEFSAVGDAGKILSDNFKEDFAKITQVVTNATGQLFSSGMPKIDYSDIDLSGLDLVAPKTGKDKKSAFDVTKKTEELDNQIKAIDFASQNFADSMNASAEKANLFKNAIANFIQNGVDPRSKVINDLLGKYQLYNNAVEEGKRIQEEAAANEWQETNAWKKRQEQIDKQTEKDKQAYESLQNSRIMEVEALKYAEPVIKTFGDQVREAGDLLLSDFVNDIIDKMPVLNDVFKKMQETAQVSGGNPFAIAGAAVMSLVEKSATFSAIMNQLNPLLQAAADTVGVLLEPLIPLIQVVSATLTPVLKTISVVASSLLLPVMQLLFPVFKGLGLAVIGVSKIFGDAWNAIANAINWALGWLGVHLNTVDTSGLQKSFNDLANLTWDNAMSQGKAADAANKLSESLSNVPEGFKIQRYRFAAENAQYVGASGSYSSMTFQAGSITVMTNNPEEFLTKLETISQRKKFQQTGTFVNSSAFAL